MGQKQIEPPFPLDNPEARKFWDNMSDAVKEVCAKYPPNVQYLNKASESPFPCIIRSYDEHEEGDDITVTIEVLSPLFSRQVFGVDLKDLKPYHTPKDESLMEQVVITQTTMAVPGIFGVATMQVCVQKDATDEEILDVCNVENPSGVTGGWSEVVRKNEDRYQGAVQCEDHVDRLHLIVTC